MSDMHAVLRALGRELLDQTGSIESGLLPSDHTPTEARVLLELGRTDTMERVELRARLGLDESFLSRVIGRLEGRGLVEARSSQLDQRRRIVGLTAAGRDACAELDRLATAQIASLAASLGTARRRAVATATATLSANLGLRSPTGRGPVIRGLSTGDLGWIVQRHGELYRDEHGWDDTFEPLVAQIVGEFAARGDREREAGFIAEIDSLRAGSILCCRGDDETTAKLRVLLVEPWARGRGVGRTLCEGCLAFARTAGYRHLTLWTVDILEPARRLYESLGFTLVSEEPHPGYGYPLTSQYFRIALT